MTVMDSAFKKMRTRPPNLSAFRNSDGILWADFDAGLAAQAFINVHRLRFSVNQLQHPCRAIADAFFTASAFLFVNSHFPHFSFSFRVAGQLTHFYRNNSG
jgi:hypothetical protein